MRMELADAAFAVPFFASLAGDLQQSRAEPGDYFTGVAVRSGALVHSISGTSLYDFVAAANNLCLRHTGAAAPSLQQDDDRRTGDWPHSTTSYPAEAPLFPCPVARKQVQGSTSDACWRSVASSAFSPIAAIATVRAPRTKK